MSEFDTSIPAGSADPTPSAPTPSPATPGQTATPTATPSASAAAPTAQTSNEGMVPSYRIRETREAAMREAQTQWQAREAEYQAKFDAVQRQLHAIVGVTPQEPDEVTAIRNQFNKLFPGLSKLEQRAADLEGLVERSGDLDQQSKHYWTSYGRQTMDWLYDAASKSLGAPISDEGKRALHSAFSGYVASSPENTARYTQDPTIVDEFWQIFSSNLIDPVRRTAQATVQTQTMNRSIPLDTPGGAPQMSPAPKPANLDERAANAWAQYQTTAKR